MDDAVRTIVEAIHLSPTQAVIFIAGGASQALGWLMSVPGASNTILEVLIPYSRTSMNQLLKSLKQNVERSSTMLGKTSSGVRRCLEKRRAEFDDAKTELEVQSFRDKVLSDWTNFFSLSLAGYNQQYI